MSIRSFGAVLRSATFRRALVHLGLVWLFLSLGALWLIDRLSGEIQKGWALRSTVVEWVDDAEAEVCLRQGGSGLEVISGGAARSIASQVAGSPDMAPWDVEAETLDEEWAGSRAEGAEPEDFEALEEGLDVEGSGDAFDIEDIDGESLAERQQGHVGAGPWLCVSREALIDDGMEALMSSAFKLTSPRRLSEPLWLGGALWLFSTAILVFWGAYRMASHPATLVLDLERVRQQIDDGDHASRLRRRDQGGDIDLAATGINAILDRLEYTISTLTEVSGNIAHDLRTPLTRLQGQLDLVRQSPSPTPAMIDSVQEEAGQLLATFNALLRIAQVKGGSRRKGFRVFDVAAVARDAFELYGPAMSEKDLSFTCLVPSYPVEIKGDAELWLQAISNLLDNALKYTPEGNVDLEVRPGNPRTGVAAQVRISDSGHGIPEGEMEKVLERFYRLSSHREQRGSGLGLSLVVAICELHGAEIELLNQDGLTILIHLAAS